MEFYIKQNATLPVLKMSTIFFTMIDVETGIPKIVSAPAQIVNLILPEGSDPEYYIYFKFTSMDTNTPGRYQGQFLIKNDEGTLILPIREELYINVQPSFISETACC